MKIEKHTKFDRVSERNGFGQYVTTGFDTEYTTIYGTVAEAIEYSYTNSCYLIRSSATEHLFRKDDNCCKYVELWNGKPFSFAERKCDIPGAGYYVHEFVVCEEQTT